MQKDQRGREHEEQQSLLYLSLYHMPAPTLAQHQRFSNTVAWSSREHILKELLIRSALGLLNREGWESQWLFLKGSSIKAFFSQAITGLELGKENPKQVTSLTQQVI